MRIPYLSDPSQLKAAWDWMITRYERDFEALRPHIEDFTLSTSVAATTFYNAKLRPTSNVHLTPKTANASAEFGNGTIYIDTPTQGAVVINHADNGNTDRIYRVEIVGT